MWRARGWKRLPRRKVCAPLPTTRIEQRRRRRSSRQERGVSSPRRPRGEGMSGALQVACLRHVTTPPTISKTQGTLYLALRKLRYSVVFDLVMTCGGVGEDVAVCRACTCVCRCLTDASLTPGGGDLADVLLRRWTWVVFLEWRGKARLKRGGACRL